MQNGLFYHKNNMLDACPTNMGYSSQVICSEHLLHPNP